MTSRQFVRQLHEKAVIAMKMVVLKAYREHEAAGVPPAIWENGKVVLLKGKRLRKAIEQLEAVVRLEQHRVPR